MNDTSQQHVTVGSFHDASRHQFIVIIFYTGKEEEETKKKKERGRNTHKLMGGGGKGCPSHVWMAELRALVVLKSTAYGAIRREKKLLV